MLLTECTTQPILPVSPTLRMSHLSVVRTSLSRYLAVILPSVTPTLLPKLSWPTFLLITVSSISLMMFFSIPTTPTAATMAPTATALLAPRPHPKSPAWLCFLQSSLLLAHSFCKYPHLHRCVKRENVLPSFVKTQKLKKKTGLIFSYMNLLS